MSVFIISTCNLIGTFLLSFLHIGLEGIIPSLRPLILNFFQMSSYEDSSLENMDDSVEGTNSDLPSSESNKRTRTSTSSTSSPDQHSSKKKPKSDLSVITSQSLSIIGWLNETITREADKKKLAKSTVELLFSNLKTLRTLIVSTETAASPVVPSVSEGPSLEVNISPAIVDEFARVISLKERQIVELEGEIVRLNSLGPATSNAQPNVASAPLSYRNAVLDRPNVRQSRGDTTARRPNNVSRTKSSSKNRSVSRLTSRNKLIKANRDVSPQPTFRLTSGSQNLPKARNELWLEVTKRMKNPKLVTIQSKSGDLVIKPQNRESHDMLKAIASEKKCQLRDEPPSKPRLQIHSVDSTLSSDDMVSLIASQNSELEISTVDTASFIRPVFKRGRRDRPTVNWIVEVNPELYRRLDGGHLYLGFSKCRVSKYEDVTQCFRCLKYGHPAAKCTEERETCAKCAILGHKFSDCTSSTLTCVNCRGGHSALDRSCSTRTRAIVNLIKRTDYGKGPVSQVS